MAMANYLTMPEKQQVLALFNLRLVVSPIEAETGVRRETASRYDLQRRALREAARRIGAYLVSPGIQVVTACQASSHGDKPQGKVNATSSAGWFCRPTATTMYCFPLIMYVIGFPL